MKRYADQKASTARTCSLRDLADGRPRTWSIMMCEDQVPDLDPCDFEHFLGPVSCESASWLFGCGNGDIVQKDTVYNASRAGCLMMGAVK